MSSDSTKVFCHNLPYSFDRRDIEDLFKDCGELSDVDIMKGRDGQNRGIAIVTFRERRDAEKAIKDVSNQRIEGRMVTCREDRGAGYVHPDTARKEERDRRDGGRGGSRSRGRDRSGGRRDRSRGRGDRSRGGRSGGRRSRSRGR